MWYVVVTKTCKLCSTSRGVYVRVLPLEYLLYNEDITPLLLEPRAVLEIAAPLGALKLLSYI